MSGNSENSEEFINFHENFGQSLRQIDPCFYLDQAWLMLQPILNEGKGKNYSDKKTNFANLLNITDVPTAPTVTGLHFLRLSSLERIIYIVGAGMKNINYFDFSVSSNQREFSNSIMDNDWQNKALSWIEDKIDISSFEGSLSEFFLNELHVFNGGRSFKNAYKHGRMVQEAHGIRGPPKGIQLLNEGKRSDFWFSYFEKNGPKSWYTLYKTDPNSDLYSLNLQARIIDSIKSNLGHSSLSRIAESPSELQPLFGAIFLSMSNYPEGGTWLESQYRQGETHIVKKATQTDKSTS